MGLLWFGLALASNHRHLLPLHGPCPRKQQSGASSLRPSCMRGQRPARGLHPRLLESQRRLRWSAPGQCSQPAVCAAASRCAARMHLAFQPLACAARSARLACASAATPGHACSSARGPHLHQQRQQTCLYLALGCTVKKNRVLACRPASTRTRCVVHPVAFSRWSGCIAHALRAVRS